MKKFVLILGLLIVFSMPAQADDNIIDIVKKFKNIITTNNQQYIATNVVYPFNISDNCPNIQNEEEFIQSFDTIFNSALLAQIITSDDSTCNLDKKQNMIFCDSPYIQLSLDGHLMDLEYTEKRIQNNEKCILKEKNKIYPSLKKYLKNIYTLETSEYIYRIDLTDDGLSAAQYRLAIWHKGQKISEKPLKFINNGKLKLYGSANNEKYIFTNKETSYIIQINTARALETIPIEIIVMDNISTKKYPAVNITNNPNLY
ncbi:MAG: hypothetical protein VZR95_04470 [Alphaproteobacteria bacterium]